MSDDCRPWRCASCGQMFDARGNKIQPDESIKYYRQCAECRAEAHAPTRVEGEAHARRLMDPRHTFMEADFSVAGGDHEMFMELSSRREAKMIMEDTDDQDPDDRQQDLFDIMSDVADEIVRPN